MLHSITKLYNDVNTIPIYTDIHGVCVCICIDNVTYNIINPLPSVYPRVAVSRAPSTHIQRFPVCRYVVRIVSADTPSHAAVYHMLRACGGRVVILMMMVMVGGREVGCSIYLSSIINGMSNMTKSLDNAHDV